MHKKPVHQQKAFRETADVLAQVQAAMNKAARQAGKEEYERLRKDNPELAGKKLHLLTGNRCLPSAEIPFTDVYLKIVDNLLYKGGLEKTQTAILEDIEERYFKDKGKISRNVWTRPLEPWAIKNIKVRITGNMDKPADITGCETLSDIRRMLKASQSHGAAILQYSGKITVNKKSVSAGKALYPIMKRREAYAIQVSVDDGKYQWIRLDALLALLGNLKMTRVDTRED